MKNLLCLLVAALAWSSLHAADFASKPIRLIVPFPAGGTADVLPRALSEKLRTRFPAGIVVENKPGAGGNIGADFVAKAEPDGHTLLVSPPGPIAINQSLYPKLTYDATRWEPVTVLAAVPNVLAVSNKLPVKSVQEFITYLKENPGKVTYASQGNGSTSHLTANLFESLTGTQMTHIPYRGTAPALIDLAGGQVDVFFDNLGSAGQLHKAGKIRILAVADNKRSVAIKDVPTFAESGLTGMQAVTWFAVVAPPGTLSNVVHELNSAFVEVLNQPDIQQRFAEQGAEIVGDSPAQMGRFVRSEAARWTKVIKDAGVTID
ncbi:MAG: tripartite tricarboxylate transporter substrate binding protein [Gammaproteobacteria bacterium]|nr:tripartite tricarboxylate transporter substrate binding protein [Gammaproteobacteria bacterium]MBU0788184.1 tripartite tricarboxylate transporter substrate binding protein [Gammaproteobacteria bacterium]MBU0815319.1 tripartite tricarboxylate transporter substrate binding protein [Gammaproteobacteria bacterium]MBU1785573.1 tripartite tricarboxylate transporter substrate binding protein [Gammaproteobacteria bacterium]